VLLNSWRLKLTLQRLNKRRYVEGLDTGEFGDAAALAPVCEAAGGIQICQAGVVVVDLGSEEFEWAPGRLGSRREEPAPSHWPDTG